MVASIPKLIWRKGIMAFKLPVIVQIQITELNALS